MPQLDFFIFFDGALTSAIVFFTIHLLVVGYLLPLWLRSRVFQRVLLAKTQSDIAVLKGVLTK